MRRSILWLLGVALVVAALCVALFQLPAVQDRLVERALGRAMDASTDALFEDDALRVLRLERETWQQLCQRLDATSPPPSGPIPGETRPELPGETGLSLEA